MTSKNLGDLSLKLGSARVLQIYFSYTDEFSEPTNSKESSDKILQICEEKGFELIEMANPFCGSEDYGRYLKCTKGAICYLGNREIYPHLHTYEYNLHNELPETAVELFKGLATK